MSKLPGLSFKRILIVTILLVSSSTLTAQRQADNWYFGYNVGLNFSTGNPIAVTGGQIHTEEGEASISDAKGQLLFYTDGVTIWNRLNQIMLNGTALLGDNSSTQSAIIVPEPGNDSLFFVFTVAPYARPAGLNYSVVNIKADNGLGAVVIKNIQLLTPTAEKITAVMHCNNKDIWVLTRKYVSDEYYAWLVTASGISSTPVISSTGMFIGDTAAVGFDEIGYLKVSPDGKKLAAAHFSQTTSSNPNGFTEFAGFNNATGQVSKSIKIYDYPPPLNSVIWGNLPYGLDFSPNSKFLYVSNSAYTLPDYHYAIYTLDQYDVSINDSALIAQSHYVVDTTSHFNYGALQLANNKKIYLADGGAPSLSVINNPNVQGAGCNFKQKEVILKTGECRMGLPTFIQNYFDDFYDKYDFSSNNNCTSLDLQFHLSTIVKVDSVKWTFGDIAAGTNNFSEAFLPSHSFTQIGEYKITVLVYKNNGCTSITDTIIKNILVGKLALNLGNDTTKCNGDTLILHNNISNTTNLWSNGTTGDTIKILQPGIYWLNITSGGCSVADTIKIASRNLPQFTLGADTTVCNTKNYILSSQTLYPGASFLWSNNNNTATLNISTTGNYWLKLVDNLGCTWRDTINVNFLTSPIINLGNDTAICANETILLRDTITNAINLWSDGTSGNSLIASLPGIYWVKINIMGCVSGDSIHITNNILPKFTLGNDTVLCNNTALLIKPNPNYNNSSSLWSTNEFTSGITVSKANIYWLHIVDAYGCGWRDTIKVSYVISPNFTLGSDTAICKMDTLVMNASHYDATSYLWNTGETTATIKAYQPGIYWCALYKDGCYYKDSLSLSLKALPAVYLGVDTTLCEDDKKILNAGAGIANYLWQDGSIGNTYIVTRSGEYIVSVNVNGCTKSDSINIYYTLKPHFTLGKDGFICQGEIIILKPSTITTWQLLWQDESTGNNYTVSHPGIYTLQATNNCGITKDTIEFIKGLCHIYVPNAFSPNGDVKNDVFKVAGTEMISVFDLQIYNRYGQLVYQSTDKTKGWDGTFNNQPCAIGAYIYVLIYKENNSPQQQRIKGSLVLIR